MYGFYDRKTARVGTKIDKSPIALFCTFQLRGVFVSIYVTNTYENPKHFLMDRLDTKAFGLKRNSRIKAFVFKFISVPAKWIRTARRYELNIYTDNKSYLNPFALADG